MAEPTSLQTSFNGAAVSPWAWVDEYRGLEGYRRMRAELVGSLLADFPELRGKVEIFDLTAADSVAEQRRVEQVLGLEKGAITDTIAEKATIQAIPGGDVMKEADRRVVVGGFGVAPDAWDKLTPKEISEMASHLSHELFHAIDFMKHGNMAALMEDPQGRYTDATTKKWYESLADAGRLSLFKSNLGDMPGEAEDRRNFIIDYNLSHPFKSSLASEGNSKMSLHRKLMLTDNPEYDNGEFFVRTLAQTPTANTATSYALQGWRSTYETLSHARENWAMLDNENASVQAASNVLMGDLARQARREALEGLTPYSAYIKDTYNAAPKDVLDAMFLNKQQLIAIEGSDAAINRQLRDVVTGAQEKLIETLRDRQDMYPGAARVVQSYDARFDPEKSLSTEPEITPLSVVLAARAYDRYAQTQSPEDLKAARYYGQVGDVAISKNTREVLNAALETNPELRKTLMDPAPSEAQPQAPSTGKPVHGLGL